MERLTEHSKSDFENIIYSGNDEIAIVKRLAAYEDTGLMPEEIKELKSQSEVLTDTVNMLSPLMMENSKLKDKCDYWEREAKKWCAALGEQRIKLQQPDCDKISKQKNGKCLGYCYSETDDEPIEKCKNCELYESYEDI